VDVARQDAHNVDHCELDNVGGRTLNPEIDMKLEQIPRRIALGQKTSAENGAVLADPVFGFLPGARVPAFKCAAANREQRTALLIHLNKYLKKTAQSFGINKDLSATEPRWQQTFKPMIWGKELGKNVVIWPQYKDKDKWCAISPHADEGGIFDFRARRSFKPQDYPAKTWQESQQIAKLRQEVARQQTRTTDNSENSSTFLAPNRNQSKNKGKNRRSKKPVD
jgi:hypothetical protein